ncbi:hypothetical protein [Rothia sp. HMSC08A08]|uniref:hypothetical protein n=1 Tax=Rothia sp. HMSC08A08 TaxID=1581132 RepID=UPI00114C9D2D|nr:hypothetical protein [Rothia sp. HMSC08A08]
MRYRLSPPLVSGTFNEPYALAYNIARHSKLVLWLRAFALEAVPVHPIAAFRTPQECAEGD